MHFPTVKKLLDFAVNYTAKGFSKLVLLGVKISAFQSTLHPFEVPKLRFDAICLFMRLYRYICILARV